MAEGEGESFPWCDACQSYHHPKNPTCRLTPYGKRLAAEVQMYVDWNAKHPVGTPVQFWPFVREGEGRISKTRSEACMLCDSAVVWVEGYASCISLTHVEAL